MRPALCDDYRNCRLSNSDPYRLVYTTTNGQSGVNFFRIKQVYSNGYSRYSNIRQVTLENSDFPKFTLYPNPSNGIVGIKFDNIITGHLNIQIYNTQRQTMVNNEFAMNGSDYVQVATLESGVYWLKSDRCEKPGILRQSTSN